MICNTAIKKVVLTNNNDRRENNANSVNDRSDLNLQDRITKFHALLSADTVY